LLPGTYHYTVAAVDSSGHEGEWSEPVVVDISESRPPEETKLPAPGNLQAEPEGNTVYLHWNSVYGAVSYNIYRDSRHIGEADGASYIDEGLLPGTYYYTVAAVDSNGNEGERSEPVMVDISESRPPEETKLPAPGNLQAEPEGNTVYLHWNSVYGAVSYNVYRNDEGIGKADGASYSEADLAPGTYHYQVAAVDSNGNEGELSEPVSVTLSVSVPTGLYAYSDGNTVNLSWNPVSGVSHYKVYRGESLYELYNLGAIEGFTFFDEAVSPGTYYYWVAAVDSSGNEGERSEPVSVTVLPLAPTPGGDTLADAKGNLTLTGFSEFNGKYVYAALVTSSGQALIGTNSVDVNAGVFSMSMAPISGGTAVVPLYTMNAAGTTVADIYVPYEGSETFQVVSIMVVNDSDGKFTADDAASFATDYAASISSNISNTSFAPSTSGGNITISRSDVMTMEDITTEIAGGNYTVMQTVKYILAVN
jgi:fibronectin type 3 domain-containing protein